ncbi:right-handed parallel beta-helix repeat-containing protein [Novipirellula artificiosorum]|uniref:Right handed beta helix domain-containing protein n=1 Tax=Novipirellula artificiosorum TaxID=2528016 RepID=A0A5C6DUI9_9BACT|nr:right-handed parallel beta-helix repeat-containing protein [Novipirellula artificiosorum]TWU41033.1 hypothetical protein Poly41_18680 [Novipirellula artificiosorum]
MRNQQHLFVAVAVGLLLLGAAPLLEAAGPIDFHVATNGDDKNPGTEAKPFATLERARDGIRNSGLAGKARCTVWLHDGVYRRDDAFTLEERDSGVPEHPVIYRAKGNAARLIGGTVVNTEAFTLVDDPDLLARIPEPARGKVYMLDLKALGIKHTARYPDKFTDNGGIFELFLDSRRMPISRYPNEHGAMTVKRVVINGGGQEKSGSWRNYYGGSPEQRLALESEKGPRAGVFEHRAEHADAHAMWAKVLDRGVWIKGYWRVVWQNETVRVAAIDTESQTVTLAVPVSNGIGSKYHRPNGSGAEIYWVMNLVEAVDQPGEWAIDFQEQKLFFYPPESLAGADILISDADAPIIELRGTHDIELRGLIVEGTLGDGVRIVDGASNAVRGCTVRNVAKYGIVVQGGSNHVVESCDLYAIGAGGVWLSGGDTKATPRVPAGHLVENCDIHHFGEIERVYAPGVNVGFRGGGGGSRVMDAVGMVVRNNAIHHCPHAGVLFNSFDNVFEYNEVFQFALVSNDMGAFYSYSKPNGIGNNTFRFNFMHSSPEGDGIYYDNVADHAHVYGNIAYRLGPSDPAKEAKRGCGFLIKNFTKNRVDVSSNIAVDCKTGYTVTAGEGSILRGNIAVACGDSHGVPDLKTYEKDPGFVDQARMNFALQLDAIVYSDVEDFEPIPVERIGLHTNDFRATVPDYRQEMSGWKPSANASRYDVLDRE